MWQIGDVLLPLHLLLHICGIVTDLKFHSIQRGWIDALEPVYSFLDQRLCLLLCLHRTLQVELSSVFVENCLCYVSSEGLSDRIAQLPALVDNHFDDVT
jgi:hypothetical protein